MRLLKTHCARGRGAARPHPQTAAPAASEERLRRRRRRRRGAPRKRGRRAPPRRARIVRHCRRRRDAPPSATRRRSRSRPLGIPPRAPAGAASADASRGLRKLRELGRRPPPPPTAPRTASAGATREASAAASGAGAAVRAAPLICGDRGTQHRARYCRALVAPRAPDSAVRRSPRGARPACSPARGELLHRSEARFRGCGAAGDGARYRRLAARQRRRRRRRRCWYHHRIHAAAHGAGETRARAAGSAERRRGAGACRRPIARPRRREERARRLGRRARAGAAGAAQCRPTSASETLRRGVAAERDRQAGWWTSRD